VTLTFDFDSYFSIFRQYRGIFQTAAQKLLWRGKNMRYGALNVIIRHRRVTRGTTYHSCKGALFLKKIDDLVPQKIHLFHAWLRPWGSPKSYVERP